MSPSTIGDVLFTKTQQKLLGLLYGRPGKSFFTNEIVRLAEMGKGTISRELEKMQRAGLLTVQRVGNQTHYQANAGCPVYSELLAIVRKTFGVADVIREAMEPVKQRVEFSFIYGSLAKGTDSSNSDIDLLVVADDLSFAELMSVLAGAEMSLGRPINPTVYTREETMARLAAGNAFLSKVMEQPKIWVMGNDDDIGEHGKPGEDREAEDRGTESSRI